MPANEICRLQVGRYLTTTEQILNIKFEEANNVYGLKRNVVSQSIQLSTAGFSYFTYIITRLGSDVFLSKTYSNPHFFSNG